MRLGLVPAASSNTSDFLECLTTVLKSDFTRCLIAGAPFAYFAKKPWLLKSVMFVHPI